MTALDVRTGKVAWQIPGLLPLRCVASPIVTPAGLIVGQCGEGLAESRVYAVKVADDGKSAQSIYEVKRTGGYVPTPIASGDFLYLWKENGLVTCLRAANNEQVWSERVQGPFYGSPIIASGRIYNVTRKGELVVLNAGDTFAELARFDLGGASFATPAGE
jgi:outer membrane protein assembly factor BamB